MCYATKIPQLNLGKKISVEFPINLFGEGMGIMLPDSEISLLSLKRLQCLKDVNIFPWFKRRQNLLRLVVSYNIYNIQCTFHLFTSLMFSYCTNEIQLTSTFITQFKYKINHIKDKWHESDKSCRQGRKKTQVCLLRTSKFCSWASENGMLVVHWTRETSLINPVSLKNSISLKNYNIQS